MPLGIVTPISPGPGDFTVVAPDYPDTTKVKKLILLIFLFNYLNYLLDFFNLLFYF